MAPSPYPSPHFLFGFGPLPFALSVSFRLCKNFQIGIGLIVQSFDSSRPQNSPRPEPKEFNWDCSDDISVSTPRVADGLHGVNMFAIFDESERMYSNSFSFCPRREHLLEVRASCYCEIRPLPCFVLDDDADSDGLHVNRIAVFTVHEIDGVLWVDVLAV